MKIETKQVNITTLYTESIFSLAQTKIDDLRRNIITLFEKEPIISQFPNFITIIEPIQQLVISIQDKTVTISNQDIKNFESRNLDNFLQLVIKTTSLLEKTISAFGYNYSYIISPDDPAEATKLTNKLNENINTAKLGIPANEFISGGVSLSYSRSDNRINMSVIPQYADDLKTSIAFIGQSNVHFQKNIIPQLAELSTSFTKEHDSLVADINKIFT